MFKTYLKDKADDPYWRGVLNSSCENLDNQISAVQSEIQMACFEMRQSVGQHLDEFVNSQEQAQRLTSELQKIKGNLRGNNLLKTIQSFKIENQIKSNIEKNLIQCIKATKSQNIELQEIILCQQSVFEKFKRCQRESDFMEIFEVEKVIQRCLKGEEYEELSRIFRWLEFLIAKNANRQSLLTIFGGVMRKYRKVLCNILFSTYQKQKKAKLLRFFIDFGKHLKSQREVYLFELFQAHFARNFRLIFDANKTQLIQVNHVANIFEIYGRALHKSIIFTQKIEEALEEVPEDQTDQIHILKFLNKFRNNLIDLVDKVRPTKLNEIKIRLAGFSEPLKTHLQLGSVSILQVSSQKRFCEQKILIYLRSITSLPTTVRDCNFQTNTSSLNLNFVQQSKFLVVIYNQIKVFKFILAINRLHQEEQERLATEYCQLIIQEVSVLLEQQVIQKESGDWTQSVKECVEKLSLFLKQVNTPNQSV